MKRLHLCRVIVVVLGILRRIHRILAQGIVLLGSGMRSASAWCSLRWRSIQALLWSAGLLLGLRFLVQRNHQLLDRHVRL
jgi:hypothetical protein